MKNFRLGVPAALVLCLLAPLVLAQSGSVHQSQFSDKLPLVEGWSLQSSAKVSAAGEEISTVSFQPAGWHQVSVPTTVVAALVKQKVYPAPFYGMNLRQLPGMTYAIASEFANQPMQPDSPFAVPWWYRKEFVLPAEFKGKTIWLNFHGINYRAKIWLNGKEIAGLDQVAGAWRTYEFNITDAVKPGAANALAVEVFAPTENDLAIGFVDWNPMPPDKNMGLWREVFITASGPVALRYPTVVSKVDAAGRESWVGPSSVGQSGGSPSAHLTVTALLKNGSSQAVRGTLKGKIEQIEFAQDVQLGPGESRDVTFEPDKFPQLNLAKPRLWWPSQMGTPNQYELNMEFEAGGSVSDRASTQFGIREIHSEVTANHGRVFTINGKRILIRGAAWTPDLMVRTDLKKMADDFRYVRDMGLNTVRIEGKFDAEEFFNLADREGVLIMAGWCCCDHWEHWGNWSAQDYEIARESLKSQIYRLRSHASSLIWLNGSDYPPPLDVEEMYLGIEKQLQWPNPVMSSATARIASLTNDSGGKMTGPYEYVPPIYWSEDKGEPHHCNPGGCGGAHGFNTETSPGPAVPPIESLREFIPKDHLWPIDEYWNFHAGGGEFKNIRVYTEAQDARYGKSESAEEFTFKSQLMAYEGIRAMYEAYSQNKYTSTGVIQWMLNNAWPSIIWHLYDYYMRPGGGYFGAKKAMEPLHPVYSYADRSVWVVSSQYQDAKSLKLRAKVYNPDMSEKFSKDAVLNAAADSTTKVFEIPNLPDASPVYFLVLRLEGANGKLVGSNFYWLSSKPETVDWEKSNWWMTATASFADYTSLSQLPKVTLKVSSHSEQKGENAITRVAIENTSRNLAFFVRLKVDRGQGGDEILPVVWEDNYISLLPGEKRGVTATYRTAQLGSAKPTVEVRGWNVEAQ